MYIDWTAPFWNGSPITGYKIYILEHDKVTYTQESVECDGTSTDVIANTICHVALDTLIVPPWSLTLNEEVWVKVIAYNVYGDSPFSEPGNNGLVKLIPDAPIELLNDPIATDHTKIGFSW